MTVRNQNIVQSVTTSTWTTILVMSADDVVTGQIFRRNISKVLRRATSNTRCKVLDESISPDHTTHRNIFSRDISKVLRRATSNTWCKVLDESISPDHITHRQSVTTTTWTTILLMSADDVVTGNIFSRDISKVRKSHKAKKPSLTLNLGTNGIKVTSEPPPMAGQAGRLQGQDRSAVTCPSSSHARRCLIWLSCDNRRTHYWFTRCKVLDESISPDHTTHRQSVTTTTWTTILLMSADDVVAGNIFSRDISKVLRRATSNTRCKVLDESISPDHTTHRQSVTTTTWTTILLMSADDVVAGNIFSRNISKVLRRATSNTRCKVLDESISPDHTTHRQSVTTTTWTTILLMSADDVVTGNIFSRNISKVLRRATSNTRCKVLDESISPDHTTHRQSVTTTTWTTILLMSADDVVTGNIFSKVYESISPDHTTHRQSVTTTTWTTILLMSADDVVGKSCRDISKVLRRATSNTSESVGRVISPDHTTHRQSVTTTTWTTILLMSADDVVTGNIFSRNISKVLRRATSNTRCKVLDESISPDHTTHRQSVTTTTWTTILMSADDVVAGNIFSRDISKVLRRATSNTRCKVLDESISPDHTTHRQSVTTTTWTTILLMSADDVVTGNIFSRNISKVLRRATSNTRCKVLDESISPDHTTHRQSVTTTTWTTRLCTDKPLTACLMVYLEKYYCQQKLDIGVVEKSI
ncbi:hypothetical protein J6590_071390 [Homalodisca vitripennis]|nr:hypothetical protein J6590_071390 [Homalodisca vitripennis]